MYYNAYFVGILNFKDKLGLDYSKFYKNNKVSETTPSPSLFQIHVLDIVLP